MRAGDQHAQHESAIKLQTIPMVLVAPLSLTSRLSGRSPRSLLLPGNAGNSQPEQRWHCCCAKDSLPQIRRDIAAHAVTAGGVHNGTPPTRRRSPPSAIRVTRYKARLGSARARLGLDCLGRDYCPGFGSMPRDDAGGYAVGRKLTPCTNLDAVGAGSGESEV